MYKVYEKGNTLNTYGGIYMKYLGIASFIILLTACTNMSIQQVEGTYTNTKGEVTTATVKFQGEKIVEVEFDETKNGESKKKAASSYGMRQASTISKEWNEQVMFLEKYIQQNGVDKIQTDDEGKATDIDILTGCTMSIDNFLKALQNAQEKIK